jgi:excisionase family DNA binding protein
MVDILTYTEAAEKLGVSRGTIGKLVKKGRLTGENERLGKAKFVTRESVESLEKDERFQFALKLSQKGREKKKGEIEQVKDALLTLKEIANMKETMVSLNAEIVKRLGSLERNIDDIKEALRTDTKKKKDRATKEA